jgi:hypothetical protein
MQTATSGGSSDRDTNELAAIPTIAVGVDTAHGRHAAGKAPESRT